MFDLRTGMSGSKQKWTSLALAILMLVMMVLPMVPKAYAGVPEVVAGWTFSATNVDTATAGSADNNGIAKLTLSGGRTATPSTDRPYKDGWSPAGGYWQAQFSTKGYNTLSVSSKQYGTNTGPRDFQLQYSTDGSTFVPFSDVYQLPTAMPSAANVVNLPSDADDKGTVYIRWVNTTSTSINGGTVAASNGNSRISEVSIIGTPIGGSTDPISVTGITLNNTAPSMTVGDAVYNLVATVFPANATNKTVDWTTNNPGVATVNNGAVTPVSAGTATITATTRDGGFVATSVVTIALPSGKTTTPNVSKLSMPNLTTVSGSAGAVGKSVQVAVYMDAGLTSAAGTATSGTDGSFSVNFNNPQSQTTVYVTAQGNGQTLSDPVAVTYVLSQVINQGDIVFSQIYTNGGNSGAFYNTKFIELYNTTDKDISFNNNWSIVYASGTATSFNAGTALNGIIKAHGYFLIGANKGATGTDLPVTPDQSTTLNPAGATLGILALAKKTTALTGDNDPDLVDLIAYNVNAATNPTKISTANWGSPFPDNTGGGTMLRKTNIGSNPREALGLGNGWVTKDNSKDFVMDIPDGASKPEPRNSKYMVSPDASKITFTQSGNTATVTGALGAVPAVSTVKVHLENNGIISAVSDSTATATAGVDGSFSLTFNNTGGKQSVYVTHKDSKESAYSRIDKVGYDSTPLTTIDQLRINDTNGLPINLGYIANIEGVVTIGNDALGTEGTNFYVQDAKGGINVINGKVPGSLQTGDKVKINGRVVFTAGVTQIVPFSITTTGTDTIPTAKSIYVSDMSNAATMEPLEGTVVSFKAKVKNIPTSGSVRDITVADSDDTTAATVRILDSTNLIDSIEQNATYTFTGIVAQSKLSSPYTSGYILMPSKATDVRGEMKLTHKPPMSAYVGYSIPVTATVKYADSVFLNYKGVGDSAFTQVKMDSTDNLSYNAKLPVQSAVGDIYYYIEAQGAGDSVFFASAATPQQLHVVVKTVGPDFFNESPALGESIQTAHPTITVSMNDVVGVNPNSLVIKIDNKDFSSRVSPSVSEIKIVLTPDDDLSVGEHTVTVSANDMNGLPSTYSWKFTVAEKFTGGNHYYGTTHNHTNISHDADGSPEEALQAALKHGYDYFAFSDHSHDIDSSLVNTDTVDHNGMKERTGGSDWALTKKLAADYTKDGQFVVFPAFEMTSTTWGHSNVFGTSNFIDRVMEGGEYQKLQNYYAWVLTYDNIVAQFNHPDMSANAFDNFIPYDKNVDKLFTMLEVGNGSGKYSYANAEGKFYSALDLGWHVAPTYGEDNHDATWGQTKKRTVIVSKDLSQDSLLDAMRNMRVYFTEDQNYKLDVLANGFYMGSTVDTKNLAFNITGSETEYAPTDPKYNQPVNANVAKVELVTNGGKVVDTYTSTATSSSFNWQPKFTVVGGQQWFVVKVTLKDGDRVYSSPVWSPVEPVAVKVSNVNVDGGALVGGVAASLQAGVSNQGTVNVNDLTVHFYYDSVDSDHFIGDASIPSLPSNASNTASVMWQNPIPGNHKIIVKLESASVDLSTFGYEQALSVKAPNGKTVMIDATHKNENTTLDSGTYKDNLKTFTTLVKQQGYTVVENAATLTDDLLKTISVLMITHPASTYSDAEIAAIDTFVKNGGSVLMTEKSNYGGTAQNLNGILKGIGSSILVNNDGVFDETKEGNFWSTPLTSNFSVRLHMQPVKNKLTDFIPLLDFYSGSSLAKNDGSGNKVPLTDSSTVTILARGNETTFQDSPQIKADSVSYNVQTSNGKNGPALDTVTGGSVIPLVATEQIGNGRIFVAGMNVFNDKQMTQNDGPTNNNPLAVNVVNWLAHLEPKSYSIGDARKLPEGTDVVIQGQVTTAAGVFFDAVYVQDETGGIMAFNSIPEGSPLYQGDVVRIYGHIKVFENNLELEFDQYDNSIVKISSGTPLSPKLVSTKDSVSANYQGQLVKVVGQVKSIPDSNSYVIDDGSGPVLIFADGFMINKTGPIPKLAIGDTLTAVGLSGKFAEGDRIRVRDTKELSGTTGAPVSVTGVTVDTNTVALTVGGTQTLAATVAPAEATNKAVTWTSNKPEVATVDSATGQVTAVAAGTATITVTTADGGFTATSVVTVTAPSSGVIQVTGVTVDTNTVALTIGGTQTLAAAVAPADATNKAVTWTTNKPEVATVDNATGQVTAVAAGTATITVTTADGGFTATSVVTVTAPSSGGTNGGPKDDSGLSGSANNGTANNGTVAPDTSNGGKETGGQVIVPADTVKNSANGKSTVDLPANTTEVKLPPNTADLLAQNQLEVKSDKVTLVVPSDLIKKLTSQVSADVMKDSFISLKFEPIPASEAQEVIAKGQNVSNSDIKLVGDIYEFKLSVTKADGTTAAVLSKFDQPITIHLKVDASVDPKLAGVYYIADDGKLEFIGGHYENGEMVAQISHFSKYAVLEVSKSFADVPKDHWAASVIKELAAKQIVNGTSDTTFEPGRNVTRAEFTALLVRAMKLTAAGQISFADVKASDWYAEAIAIAVKAGIVNGKSEAAFDPNAQITREEMVAMMMRAYAAGHGNQSAGKSNASFTDEAEVSAWAIQYVNQAAELQLVQGRSAGIFDPKGITTRAEAAQVIYNVLTK